MKKEEMYPTSVRIPESLKNELEKICDKETRSLSNVILRACVEYVERHKNA